MKTPEFYPIQALLLPNWTKDSLPNRRLFTLWEIMNQIRPFGLCNLLPAIDNAITCLDSVEDRRAPLTELEQKGLVELLGHFPDKQNPDLAVLGGIAASQALDLRYVLTDIKNGHDVTREKAQLRLEQLQGAILSQLILVKLVVISESKAGFLDKGELFGKDVAAKFPSAAGHIKDAGNCLAVDLNTAAVYHLMCVVETGLRALAKHLKVKTIKKHVPIEYGTWEEILVALDKKITALGGTTRGKKRQQALDFYNELLREFRSIRDIWRNRVMHARETYTYHRAKDAFDHVKAFMQRLATRVSETN